MAGGSRDSREFWRRLNILTGRALSSYQSAIALNSELALAFPSEAIYQSDLAGNHFYVGNIYVDLEMPVDALASFAKGIEIQKTLVEEHPGDPYSLSQLGASCNRIVFVVQGLHVVVSSLRFFSRRLDQES